VVFHRVSKHFTRHGVFEFVILAMAWPLACGRSKSEEIKVVRATAPAFPQIMAQSHTEGSVVVRVHVDAAGHVSDTDVVETEGNALMTSDAYGRLARQWVFEETGRAHDLEIHIVYRLMPPDSHLDELGTTFEFPATVVVRGRAVAPEATRDFAAPK
jgi:Gram-negative bacterial TonB protein C-terminal